MFRKYHPDESVSGRNQVKSSVRRAIRAKIVDEYPALEDHIDDIIPKKASMLVAKCPDHVQLVVVDGEALFFSVRNDHFFPSLRVLHKYPDMMPRFQTDRGAIRFVLSGADIMCPGLTSAGAVMVEVDEDTPVAIYAEGKKHAMAVGLTKLSTAEIRSINKGHGVRTMHYLNDGLWQNPALE